MRAPAIIAQHSINRGRPGYGLEMARTGDFRNDNRCFCCASRIADYCRIDALRITAQRLRCYLLSRRCRRSSSDLFHGRNSTLRADAGSATPRESGSLRQCLGHRRIPTLADLRRKASAWNEKMHRHRLLIDWRFTRAKARQKFRYTRHRFMRSEQ